MFIKGTFLSVFSVGVISFLLQDLSLRWKGTDRETSHLSSGAEGREDVGGKVRRPVQSSLGGRGGKGLSAPAGSPRAAAKGRRGDTGCRRRPPSPRPPRAAGTASGAGPYERPLGKSHNSGQGPDWQSTARESGSFPEGPRRPEPNASIMRQKRCPGAETDSVPFLWAG